MPSRLSLLLFALTLPACASHEGPSTSSGPTAGPTPDPPHPAPHAEIQIAVASVQLIQDCPDPPDPVPAAPAAAPSQPGSEPAAAAAMPAPDANMKEPAPAAARMKMGPGAGAWQPPCTQSTVQLSLTNTGDKEGKVRINGIKLFDSATKRELGPISSRKPGLWNENGTYQPWDERVAPGATVKVTYRLGEPDWMAIQGLIGANENLYARPLLLEVDINVDERAQNARSPEFTRQEVHMVVT